MEIGGGSWRWIDVGESVAEVSLDGHGPIRPGLVGEGTSMDVGCLRYVHGW